MALQSLAGAAVGLLLGLLVGLSSSPVVSVVIGALASGLMVLLGLANNSPQSEIQIERINAGAARLLGFGLVCSLAVIGGMYIRTHDLMTPSPKAQVDELAKAGFKDDEAHAWVAYKNSGLLFRIGADSVADKDHGANGRESVLFANSGVDNCRLVSTDRFPSEAEQMNALRLAGGRFAALEKILEGFDSQARSSSLAAMKAMFC